MQLRTVAASANRSRTFGGDKAPDLGPQRLLQGSAVQSRMIGHDPVDAQGNPVRAIGHRNAPISTAVNDFSNLAYSRRVARWTWDIRTGSGTAAAR